MEGVGTRQRKYKLATKEVVNDRRRKQTLFEVDQKIIRKVLQTLQGGAIVIKSTVDVSKIPGCGNISGVPDVVKLRTNSRPFEARRAGKEAASRFANEPAPQSTSLVTVVMERLGYKTYGLGSAYFGTMRPPEPHDRRALQREAKRCSALTGDPEAHCLQLCVIESQTYWNEHAFRLGSDSLICSQCNEIEISAEETVHSLYFNKILCKDCAGKN